MVGKSGIEFAVEDVIFMIDKHFSALPHQLVYRQRTQNSDFFILVMDLFQFLRFIVIAKYSGQ